jgi:C1A family cysteine protease
MEPGLRVNSWIQLNMGDENQLANVLGTIGPVTAYIYAGSNNFGLYKGGVYSDPACAGKNIDHAVNLVGYTSSYYILRNSWGTGFGMNGYMYITRGSNMCQVANYNAYPKVRIGIIIIIPFNI